MNLAPILRQSVSWEVGTQDSRGDRTYGTPSTIPGRSVGRLRDIIAANGETTTVTTLFTILIEPAVGDRLNGREVVTVAELRDFTGTVVGYQAMTR